MNAPDWFAPLLQQFPIVGIVFGVAWLAVRWVARRADAEVARMQQAGDEAKRSHNAEIRRQERRHGSEIARLLAQIDQLQKRFDDED